MLWKYESVFYHVFPYDEDSGWFYKDIWSIMSLGELIKEYHSR